MLLFPRTRFTQNLVMAYWPFMALGGIYALILLAALVTAPAGLELSLSALQRNLTADWGLLAAWTHFLTLDLFAGVWIFRDAKYWGVKPLPYLLLTFLVGPVGLGSYLLVRRQKSRVDPVRTVN